MQILLCIDELVTHRYGVLTFATVITVRGRFPFVLVGAGVESELHIFNISVLRVTVTVRASSIQLRDGRSSVSLTRGLLNADVSGLDEVANDEVQFFVTERLRHGTLSYRWAHVDLTWRSRLAPNFQHG